MAATDEQKNIEDMFGSDSESEEDTFKGSSLKPSAVNESSSGLFGSDSESEEDEKPKKLKKPTKSASKPPKPAKRKVSARAADDDEGTERRVAQPRRDEGDEYDSGEEAVRTKDDDAFIDDEDDLGGVLDEYDQDNQNFDDERPDDEGDRFTSRHEDDYFEETLKSMKTGRGRSKLKMSQQEIETLVQELLYNMDKAYNDDQVAMEEKKPALQKLKLVNSVLLLARKHQLQLPLLDFDFLGVVKKWIQPMENGLLPNIGLRTKMIEMCQTLPIDKEHLKRSGFGKVIMALWKHPHETPENKEICRQLIDRWSRSVFSKTLDFTKLSELEAEKREANGGVRPTIDRRPANQRNVESVRNRGFLNRGNTATDSSNSSSRVRMPEQIRIDFTLRPQPKVDASQIPSTKVDPESKKARLMKRMQIIARPTKRAKRAVKMSIEGRGLQS